MPLAGTRVIPDGWSAHHRPIATGAMTATCNLRRPGGTGKAFDGTTGTTTRTPHTPYLSGAKCRIQAQSVGESGTEHLVAEQQITTMPYLVTVDWSVAGAVTPEVDDLVDVTACEDPMLVGKTATVKSVVTGSLVWERDLICVIDLG